MWKCPKCNREFKRIYQSHYCIKIDNVDEYIKESNNSLIVARVIDIICNTLNAKEMISWSMSLI